MGTQTLGSTTPGSNPHYVFYNSTGVAVRADTNPATTPGDIYVDAIYVYARCYTGSGTFRHGLYRSSNGAFLGEADTNHSWNTTEQWTHSEFSAGSYLFIASGTGVQGAVLRTSSGGIQVPAINNNQAFLFKTGNSSFPTSGWSTKSSWGDLAWYATYFPAATITGLPSTPQFPGATIDIFGLSFSAGVTGVTLNGVACSSVSVISDTHLTCVLPANATTGPVQVATNAGTATSAGNLVVSGGRVFNGGTLKSTTAVRIYNGGTLKPVTRIRVYNGGTLKDAH